MKSLIQIIFVLGFFVLIMVGVLRVLDRKGYENLEKCQNLKAGMTRQELIATLGDPVKENQAEGYSSLYFAAPQVALDSISAKMNLETNVIESLECQTNKDLEISWFKKWLKQQKILLKNE
jgi:hypothetical protein